MTEKDAIDETTGEVLAEFNDWTFVETPPTPDAVGELLASLKHVWGVETTDFADYVQPLPQKKKVDRFNERGQKYVETVPSWTLYMSVAGRVQMVNTAALLNEWRIDFEPEPVTPTGIPGYLNFEGRLVYREYCTIYERGENGEWRVFGRRPGTAWVPSSGGTNAAGTNPFEKVETSARGRAIATWGFGVFPGSGIASLEEMQGADENRRTLARPQAQQQEEVNPANVLEEILTRSEHIRQMRGIDHDASFANLKRYLVGRLGIQGAWDDKTNTPVWGAVRPAQLTMLLNDTRQVEKQLEAQEAAANAGFGPAPEEDS